MEKFNRDKLDEFLATVRKYMLLRGNLTQKDLADITNTAESTISRFINKKTKEFDANLIAIITARLSIPLHEIIDFVNEFYSDTFIKLVKVFRSVDSTSNVTGSNDEEMVDDIPNQEESFDDVISSIGTAKRKVNATVTVGGKKTKIPFTPDENAPNSQVNLKEKIQNLSPRQKAYLTDFLNLDVEGKDLMVDLGNSLFRYFRQKGMEF
jgi:transcriptional regulator with XRE-family HTH domain